MYPAVSKGSKNVHQSDYNEVFPLPKAASWLHLTPFWMYSNVLTHTHTHTRTGVHDSHGWTWGGRCVLELTVPGYRPKIFLNATAEQTTSKDEPSKSGSVRIKGDSWEQGGWTGQDLFRNHFYSHS